MPENSYDTGILPPLQKEQESTLPAFVEETKPALSAEALFDHAQRYSFALKGDFSAQEEFSGMLNAGLVDSIREQAAIGAEMEKTQLHTDLVRSLAGLKDKTPQEEAILQDVLQKTANLPREDRQTILERKFGGALAAFGVSIGGTEEAAKELSDPTGAGLDKVNYLVSNIAVMQAARTWAAEKEAARQEKGWGSTLWELGVNSIPFLEQGNLALNMEGEDFAFGLGGKKEAIREKLLWMDDGEAAIKEMLAMLDGVSELSEWQAIEMARYIAEGSFSDEMTSQFITVFDAATLGSSALVKGPVKGISKAAIKTAAAKSPTAAKVFGNFGKTKDAATAAVVDASKNIKDGKILFNKTDREAVDQLKEVLDFTLQVSDVRNPTHFMHDASAPFQTMAAQMMETQLETSRKAFGPLLSKVRPSRATTDEYAETIAKNEKIIQGQGRVSEADLVASGVRLPDLAPIGTKYEPHFRVTKTEMPEENVLDIGYLTVEYGNPITKQGFTTAEEAKRYAGTAMKLSPGSVEVKQYGAYYFAETKHPLVEFSDGSLKATMLDDAKLPDNVNSLILSKVLSADTFLSKHDIGTTKVAQHLPSMVKAALDDTVDLIKQANENKTQFQEFVNFLHKQTTEVWHEVDEFGSRTTKMGRWSNSAGELEVEFMKYAGRGITQKEMQAYMSYRTLQDVDWAFRATRMLQQMQSKGYKMIQVNPWNTPSGAARIKPFHGRQITKLPDETGKEFNIAFLDKAVEKIKVVSNRDTTGKLGGNYNKAELQRLIDEEGYRLIEVMKKNNMPLRNILGSGKKGFKISDERIDYVLVRDFHQRNLGLRESDTLGRSQGGHHVYNTKEYLVQDQVHISEDTGKAYPMGPKSAAGFQFEGTKDALESLEDMNKIRMLMDNGDEAGALAYARQSKLPYEAEDFISRFKERVNPETGEILPAVWSTKVPFRIAKHGEQLDKDQVANLKKIYPTLRSNDDLLPESMDDIDKKFVGQRSEELLDTIITKNGGRVVKPAPMRDAIDVINSAAHNMVRASAMDNVKVSAVNKWMAKYGRYIDGDPDHIKNNPQFYFHNGTMNSADKAVVQMAKIEKQAVTNILGTPTDTQNILDVVKSKLKTTVYEKFGEDIAQSLDRMALMRTRDPFKFARAFAFHTKIGLFNPVQAFLQAQSVAHGLMISGDPPVMWSSLAGYSASRMIMKNPNQRKFAASVAKKMGYKGGGDEFLEAHDWMVRYGLNRIEGEHALLDDLLETNMFQGKAGRFIDKGAMFFREGELVPRMTSWHVAWQEWRKANPNAKPKRADLEAISARQDNLINNMTRKSSADIQHGWTSTATQFWSWQLRLAESMLGKKLTPAERGRLLVGYSAMYGIPGMTAGAVGIPTAVIGAITEQVGIDVGPLGSMDHYADIKKYAIENGLDPDTGWLEVGMDGLLSTAFEAITGMDTNFAQRMGPGGMFLWEQIAKNEAGIIDLLGGAAYGIGKDAWLNMAPVTDSFIKMAGLDQEFNAKRTFDEIIQATSVISSVNNARLAYDLMRYGEYRFRNGTLAENQLEMGYALVTGVTGISPQSIPDGFLQQEMMTESSGKKSKVSGDVAGYLKEHRRLAANAMKHWTRGDNAAYENYMKSASAIGDIIQTLYPEHAFKLGKAFTEQSMVEQVGERFTRHKAEKGIE